MQTDIKTSQVERFQRRKQWKSHEPEESGSHERDTRKTHDPLCSNRRWWEMELHQTAS